MTKLMSNDRNKLSESLKLRSLLRQLPSERLLSISSSWGFVTREIPQEDADKPEHLADYLYPRMNSTSYFQQMWERLEEEERDALKFIAIHGGQIAREELSQRQFKGAVRSFKKVVDSLLTKGLAYESSELSSSLKNEDWLLVPEAFLAFIELPIHCENFLGRLLLKASVEDLSAMGMRILGLEEHRLGAPLDLRFEIRRHLLDPANLDEAINALPEIERHVFEDLLNRKGQCLYRDLLDATGARKVDHSKAEYINSLAQSTGLVFTVSEGHNKYMNSLMIPRDLHYIINRKFQPDNRSLQRIEAMAGVRKNAPTLPPLDNSQDALRDLAVFSARLDIFQPKKLTTGGINKSDLKKIAAIFPATKQGRYTTFLSTYLITSGAFIDIEGSWRSSETFPEQLTSPETTFMALFQWWMRTTDWNVLFADGVPPAGEKPPQLWTNIVELRLAVLGALSSLQKDRWVDYASFWETLVPILDARLPKGSGGGGYGGVLSVKDAVAVIIRESLYFLGVTLIANTGGEYDTSVRTRGATSRGKGAITEVPSDFQFKLSPIGRALVSSPATSLTYNMEQDENPLTGMFQHSADWVIIQPNLEIVAPRDLNLSSTFQLARLCTVKNMDVMTTMELSRDSLRPAVERGAAKETILSFLGSISRMELPASVHQLIDESTTRHGEVRLGSSSGYIIADDKTVLEAIWRHPRLTPYIKERYGDNVLLLASETDLARVAKELRNQGHTPQMETGSVHANQDNRFHISLTEMEMQDVIAAVRFLAYAEKLLDTDLSDGRASTLAHRLQPDSTGFLISGTGVETRAKQIQRRFEHAFNKHDEEIVEKYKAQVSKLVSRSMTSRGPSKYQYKGANPAVDREDIEKLLSFAQEYELEVELLYVKQNEQETRVTVQPVGLEGERLYAHNSSTDTDAIYNIPRILRARLL